MPIVQWGLKKERDGKGPWVEARYEGTEKTCCGERTDEGELIRADGDGGWEGQCCYNEDD